MTARRSSLDGSYWPAAYANLPLARRINTAGSLAEAICCLEAPTPEPTSSPLRYEELRPCASWRSNPEDIRSGVRLKSILQIVVGEQSLG